MSRDEKEHCHRVARGWFADPKPGTLAEVITRERQAARDEALEAVEQAILDLPGIEPSGSQYDFDHGVDASAEACLDAVRALRRGRP